MKIAILAFIALPATCFAAEPPSGASSPTLPFATRAAESDERNLLTNGNFEDDTAGWELLNFGKNGTMEIDTSELHDGEPTLRVENLEACHSFIRQIVTAMPNTRYRITGYIKTQDVIVAEKGRKSGATVEIGRTGIYTQMMERTEPWRKVSVDFTTTDTGEVRIGPSLGTDPVFVTGVAWFSDLRLTELAERLVLRLRSKDGRPMNRVRKR